MIGHIIQNLRKRENITQEELALKLGINRATLSKYESGTIEPSFSTLQAISKILKVPVSLLIGEGWGQSLSDDLQNRIHSTIYDRVCFELSTADPADMYEVFGTYDGGLILDRWFKNGIPLTLSKVEEIADELGVPIEYLLGQTEEPLDPIRTDQERHQLFKIEMLFDKLNSTGQQKAVERVEELTEIPKYQRQDAPQSSPASPTDEDQPPQDPPEGS